ncbi:hypothetical protein KEM52_002699 [Ascosphaera acerosa]|nr:hypothetical protein KEM52_002699 [Ascosphaera acerosa]
MATSFSRRRVARKIVTAEDENGEDAQGAAAEKPTVRRSVKTSTSRQVRRLAAGADDGEEEEDTVVVRPKKHGLRALDQSPAATPPPATPALQAERPSYTKETLQSLKDSTPSLPSGHGLGDSHHSTQSLEEHEVDVAAKFGEIVKIAPPSSIPTEAEIKEKKERRARLAKEYAAEDFISLEADDDDEFRGDLRLVRGGISADKDTRLVRDDEDFAEGFDEFVDDRQVALGKRAERAQKAKQRSEMQELIEEAEESSDEDDSDAENRAAYEAAQTRAAMYGHQRTVHAPARPSTPPKMTPLPRLSDCIVRLQTSLGILQSTNVQLVQRLDELRREKLDIAQREEEIQRLLKEAGEKYAQLQAEAGAAPASQKLLMNEPGGLENLAALGSPSTQSDADVDMTDD